MLLLFLLLCAPSVIVAQGTVPVFSANFPSSAQVSGSAGQITYNNNALRITNATQAYIAFLSNSLGETSMPTVLGGGFSLPSPPYTTLGGTNWYSMGASYNNPVLTISPNLTPGTNTAPVTNYCKIWATNAPTAASSYANLAFVVAPPPPNAPTFRSDLPANYTVLQNTNQVVFAPSLLFPPDSAPVEIDGPADATNGEAIYALFLSNSLGDTDWSTAQANTGFSSTATTANAVNGAIPAPSNPANNLFLIVGSQPTNANPPWQPLPANTGTNVFVDFPFTPGTNQAQAYTNYFQLIALNVNNNTSPNTTITNFAVTVLPPPPGPPALEVRFFKTTTNAASNVFILPTFKNTGANFYWVKNSVTNWWSNNPTMTLTLDDIGVSGTNTQGERWYSIFTTNANNSAWFVSYGGGHLQWSNSTPYSSTAVPSGGQPTAASGNGNWFGYEWNAFELTVAGAPTDVGDTTYLNEFSIPMVMRVFTNTYENALAGVYTNSNSLAFYQIGGWTNFSSAAFNSVAKLMTNNFSKGVITNSSGVPVMVAGPSSCAAGLLVTPTPAVSPTDDTQNVFPRFTTYFTDVQNSGVQPRIKDYIGLATNGKTYYFYYDFFHAVTSANNLKLSGSIRVTNAPGTPNFSANYSGLAMEIGADQGGSDNWASWSVYTAPTPANFVTNGAVVVYTTNSNVPAALQGTPVFMTSGDWAQVATDTGTGGLTTSDTDLYNSSFGTAVMGRILGDLCAGYALGYINSSTNNPATGKTYGSSPSGTWWGGNEYPSADTNTLAYNGVNPYPNYSLWGDLIHNGTVITYGYPIYDRLQAYGQGTYVLQPSTSTNAGENPPGTIPPNIWAVEVEFFNGLASIGSNPGPSPAPTPVPSLTANPISLNLGATTVGTPSAAHYFTLTGSKLTGNVTVTAPSGFNVSTSLNSNYGTACTLAPVGGNVGPTTVFVRMPANTVGFKSGNVVVKSTGASTQNVAVQGTVNPATAPSIIPKPTSLTRISATSPNPGSSKSFAVTTVSVNQNITVTAPAGFQVALNGEGFGSSVTLPSKGGAVNVRICRNAPLGLISGSVSLQSGATTAGVSVSGTVNAAPTPTPAPTPKPTPTPPVPGFITITPATVTVPSTTAGTASQPGQFLVSGVAPGIVVLSGDNPNFQLSLSASGPWSADPVLLTPIAGVLDNVPVYVRVTGVTQGNFTDDIVGFVGGLAQAYATVFAAVAPAPAPRLTLLPVSLSSFETSQGNPSAYQLMELKSAGISSKTGITIDAPAGFQVALGAAGPWGKSVTRKAGQLPAAIYVRLSGHQAGSYSGFPVYAFGGGADASALVNGTTHPPISLGVSATRLSGFTRVQGRTINIPSAAQRVLFGPAAPCVYTGPITIVAPYGYEISNDGNNWCPTINYKVPPGWNGTQWVDELFVRLSAKTTVGNYTTGQRAPSGGVEGHVTLATSGLPSGNPNPVKISVSGKVTQ